MENFLTRSIKAEILRKLTELANLGHTFQVHWCEGDEGGIERDPAEALEEIYAADLSWLLVNNAKGDRIGACLFIPCNDLDIVSDWTVSSNADASDERKTVELAWEELSDTFGDIY